MNIIDKDKFDSIVWDMNINFKFTDLVPGATKDEWLDSQDLNSPFKPLFDEARQKVKSITIEQVENILKSLGYDEVEIESDSFMTQRGRIHNGQLGPFDSCMLYFRYINYNNNEKIDKIKLKRRLLRLI